MPFKHNYLHIKNEEGSGLILALMTLMVLSILGASLGAITIGSYKLGDVNRDDASAYYIAEAGANMAYEEMEKGVLNVYGKSTEGTFFPNVDSAAKDIVKKINFNKDDYLKLEPQFGNKPILTIDIKGKNKDVKTTEYIITSTAEIDGKKRTVEKPVEVTWVKEEEADIVSEGTAIVSKGLIDLKKHTEIIGNVLVKEDSMIEWPGNSAKSVDDVVKGNVNIFKEGQFETEYESLASSFPASSQNVNNLYKEFGTLKLSDLTINQDEIINIYVANEIIFDMDNVNQNNDFRNLRIFYAGSKEININNSFTGSLFVKQAAVKIGRDAAFSGVLVSGSDKGIEYNYRDSNNGNNGNSNDKLETFVIAPLSKIIFSNKADIKGFIIGKSVEITNMATIEYSSMGSFPFSDFVNRSGGGGNTGNLITSDPIIESK